MQKIYQEDREKMRANKATANELAAHNIAVDKEKTEKFYANRRAFVPRKDSHKSLR